MILKTPYNQMPFTLVLKSIDRNLYRDQYCIECGHPFMAISDKFVTLYDGTTPVDKLRQNDRVLEHRCRFTHCEQYYRIIV